MTMKSDQISENMSGFLSEPARLDAVSVLSGLEFQPESELHGLASLALSFSNADVALIVAVGETQIRILAQAGNAPAGRTDFWAFGANALVLPEGESLVVPDVTADKRFSGGVAGSGGHDVRVVCATAVGGGGARGAARVIPSAQPGETGSKPLQSQLETGGRRGG